MSKSDKYYNRYNKTGKKQSYYDYVSSWWSTSTDRLRSKFFWFLKPFCPPEECHMHMKSLHLTCLTCPTRRFHRDPQGKFRRYPRALMVLESASGRGFVLPKRYMTYGLFIPVGIDGQASIWKRILLKLLMTVAERIAEV